MSPTRVQLGADGRAVVVKEAPPGPAAERLRAEARVLRRAAHPGVVALESLTERPDGSVAVTTVHAGVVVDRADAAVLAAVASTLADLHERGLAHGRVAAEHVLVGPDGRPVLCGFAGPGDASPADDVVALGRLAVELGPDDDRLRAVAARALVDDPSARPGMRALALGFEALVAPPRLVVAPRRRASPDRRKPVLAGAAAVALAIALGTVILLPGREERPSVAPATTPTTTTTTTTVACPSLPTEGADVDGDGCPEPVSVDGPVVAVDGERWAVGVAGDVVAVGDWDCDGRATAAVLRPSTGELFTYDAWGDDRRARPAGAAPGAATLAAVDPDGDGCDELRAR